MIERGTSRKRLSIKNVSNCSRKSQDSNKYSDEISDIESNGKKADHL